MGSKKPVGEAVKEPKEEGGKAEGKEGHKAGQEVPLQPPPKAHGHESCTEPRAFVQKGVEPQFEAGMIIALCISQGKGVAKSEVGAA